MFNFTDTISCVTLSDGVHQNAERNLKWEREVAQEVTEVWNAEAQSDALTLQLAGAEEQTFSAQSSF